MLSKLLLLLKTGQLGFQDAATPMMQGIINLHHDIFFFLVFIAVFVSWILVRALWHFNHKKNLVPQRVVHGTTIQILGTFFLLLALVSLLISFSEGDSAALANLFNRFLTSSYCSGESSFGAAPSSVSTVPTTSLSESSSHRTFLVNLYRQSGFPLSEEARYIRNQIYLEEMFEQQLIREGHGLSAIRVNQGALTRAANTAVDGSARRILPPAELYSRVRSFRSMRPEGFKYSPPMIEVRDALWTAEMDIHLG